MRISDWSSDVCSSDLADGDLQGGLRNLWDIHCMTVGFLADDPDFYLTLMEEAHVHGLTDVVRRGLRLAQRLYGTPLRSYRTPMTVEFEPEWADQFYIRRLLARDDWGRMTRPLLEQRSEEHTSELQSLMRIS